MARGRASFHDTAKLSCGWLTTRVTQHRFRAGSCAKSFIYCRSITWREPALWRKRAWNTPAAIISPTIFTQAEPTAQWASAGASIACSCRFPPRDPSPIATATRAIESLNMFAPLRHAKCRILSVPCGLPRDLLEASRAVPRATRFFGLDIDPQALSEARSMISDRANFALLKGDAFELSDYPPDVDLITSSGFAEFLDDEALVRFYESCYAALAPGGVLISSSTVRNRLSDFMLTELAELCTNYRNEGALTTIFEQSSFHEVELKRDPVGYQILIRARKPGMLA
jgi:SAM-dependent methyltransferase